MKKRDNHHTSFYRDMGVINSLDDFVTQYIPSFTINDPFSQGNTRNMTIRELLSHTAGMPREGCNCTIDCFACNETVIK